MDIAILKRKLRDIGAKRYYYSIYGDRDIEEGICLDFENGKWIVYNIEREEKFDCYFFSNEESAFSEMCKRLEIIFKEIK
ncbi:hypothetical protein [Fusobacterium sp. PH5-44]|uniref:hypothetical protein n=1 Tax=unclassified Fusobacterium TaxID=2648384 RepID=UPI003D2302A0